MKIKGLVMVLHILIRIHQGYTVLYEEFGSKTRLINSKLHLVSFELTNIKIIKTNTKHTKKIYSVLEQNSAYV